MKYGESANFGCAAGAHMKNPKSWKMARPLVDSAQARTPYNAGKQDKHDSNIKGVVQETLDRVSLNCNQISNDVRGRIAKKSISSLRSVKIQACIDLLIPLLMTHDTDISH